MSGIVKTVHRTLEEILKHIELFHTPWRVLKPRSSSSPRRRLPRRRLPRSNFSNPLQDLQQQNKRDGGKVMYEKEDSRTQRKQTPAGMHLEVQGGRQYRRYKYRCTNFRCLNSVNFFRRRRWIEWLRQNVPDCFRLEGIWNRPLQWIYEGVL